MISEHPSPSCLLPHSCLFTVIALKKNIVMPLEKIVTECRTASTLLDALLSLAQSDNFVHEVAFKKIDLCELVVSGCRRVEDLAESSGILLDWHLPPETVCIQGDEILLQRLLGILLDNAIRYTPESGEIRTEVSFACEPRVGDGARYRRRHVGGRASARLRSLLSSRSSREKIKRRQWTGSFYRAMDRRCARCGTDRGKHSARKAPSFKSNFR